MQYYRKCNIGKCNVTERNSSSKHHKWSEEVQNNTKEVEKVFRQNPRKGVMQLKNREKTETKISKQTKCI